MGGCYSERYVARIGEPLDIKDQDLYDESDVVDASHPAVPIADLSAQFKILLSRYLNSIPLAQELAILATVGRCDPADAINEISKFAAKDKGMFGWDVMEYLCLHKVTVNELLIHARALMYIKDDVMCHADYSRKAPESNTYKLLECAYYLYCMFVSKTVKGRCMLARNEDPGKRLRFAQKRPTPRPGAAVDGGEQPAQSSGFFSKFWRGPKTAMVPPSPAADTKGKGAEKDPEHDEDDTEGDVEVD